MHLKIDEYLKLDRFEYNFMFRKVQSAGVLPSRQLPTLENSSSWQHLEAIANIVDGTSMRVKDCREARP